ncbi:MAG: SpoIIE family protein phosphatase [Eubacterium sp.]|nr:SpoIIE family protein phosphatase [Eubacterium sp.]
MSQRDDKQSKKVIKNRTKAISKLFNKWIILFMLVYLFISGIFGGLLATYLTDNETKKTLFFSIDQYMDVTVGYMYSTLYSNTNAIIEFKDTHDHYSGVDAYLQDEVRDLNLRELHVVSPDGIIRHSSVTQLVGKKTSDIGGARIDLRRVSNAEERDNYYRDCKLQEEYQNENKIYYCGQVIGEDCFVGKKGWMVVLGIVSSQISEELVMLSRVYCQSVAVGNEGMMIVLDREQNPDGTYSMLAPKDDGTYYGVEGDDVPEKLQLDLPSIAEESDDDSFSEIFKYNAPNGTEYYAMYHPYNKTIAVALYPRWEAAKMRVLSALGFTFALFVLSLSLLIILNRMLKKGIVRPLQRMNTSLERISMGELDVRMDVTDNREFAMLSDDINIMVLSLKRYIRDAEGRIDKELALARTIQHSSVPNTFPPFPDRNEFAIYASMDTAREVGGDFYDFFFIDDDHLAIVIADVSDKGIPAAMFMMQAKARIHGRTMQGGTPAQIMYDVNNALCDDNEAKLFITIWLAIIELSTGKGIEVNAGHEHPALYRDGAYRLIKYPHSPPVAVMKNMPYANRDFVLQPGEKILVYTDGVTDAVNENNERFGDDGLMAVLDSAGDLGPEETITELRSAIGTHTGNAKQFDDITICSFSYFGKHNTIRKLEIPAEPEKLNEVVAFVCDDIPSSDKSVKLQIRMAVEEIFINIASYAYTDGEGTVTVTRELIGDPTPKIILTFYDSGFKYNPLDKEDPDITLEAKERRIGGLGIFLVKEKMDEMTYTYENGMNVLRLVKEFRHNDNNT